jgi:Tfp pilus assembly protein PilX
MKPLTRIRSRSTVLSGGNDEGMLSMVMVVMIIGLGLAALMTPLVVTQSRITSHTDSQVQELQAAEDGLRIMLGRLHNATMIGGVPCPDHPLTATQSESRTTGYSVTVKYSPNVDGCSSTIPETATIATITSTGTAGTGTNQPDRILCATYTFDNPPTPPQYSQPVLGSCVSP